MYFSKKLSHKARTPACSVLCRKPQKKTSKACAHREPDPQNPEEDVEDNLCREDRRLCLRSGLERETERGSH